MRLEYMKFWYSVRFLWRNVSTQFWVAADREWYSKSGRDGGAACFLVLQYCILFLVRICGSISAAVMVL